MILQSRVAGLALPLGTGAVMALGLAPLGAWGLSLSALVVLGWSFLRVGSVRRAAFVGWLAGAGYFALGLMWIVEPFLVDIQRHGWMAPFALILMAGGLALFWAAGFAAAFRSGRTPATRIAALIATWTLAEFARAYLLTGFPWAALAQIWADTGVAALLAWIGPHGLAMATLGAVLPLSLLRWDRLWAVLPVGAFALAALLAVQAQPVPEMTGKTVRLIQPNAPQHKKWDPDHVWTFFQRSLDLTGANPADKPPDLIVWPETSVPPFLKNAGRELAAIARVANGVPVVVGLRRSRAARIFNALTVLGSDGAPGPIYDKHHLVPFGEYIPLGDLAARFGLYGFAASDGQGFSAGPGPALIPIAGFGRALPLICYEAVFPQDVNGAPARADMLLQITNDAWFGAWSGPYQHLAQARMRAIEQGLPMIRAANTGISAVIGPTGRIVGALPLNTAGSLDLPVPAPLPPTLYARGGDSPALLAALVLALLVLLLQLRRKEPIAD